LLTATDLQTTVHFL